MFKLLKKIKLKEAFLIFFSIFFIVAQVWLDLKLPDYMSNITTLVKTPGSQMTDILNEGKYMLLCAVGSLLTSVVIGFLASFIGAGFAKTLRSELFDKVYTFGMEEIKKFSISSLITRTTNDITRVQQIVSMGMQVAVRAPIMAVWAISKILDKSMALSGLTAVTIVLLVLTMVGLMSLVIPKFKIIQELTDEINGVTRENLLGVRVIRAYNAEKYQLDKFEAVNKKLTKTSKFTNKVMSFMWPLIDLMTNGLTLAIYVVGALLLQSAAMENRLELFSNIIVFSNYSMQVVASFMMIVMIFIMYPRVSVSAKRILEVLETNPKVLDGNIDKENSVTGKIEFKNVYFKYPDSNSYSLENISFVANKGETVAFIGATGCGKSTLVNLIPRFYDVTSGEILIDEINIKEYTKNLLYSKLGYVPQKSVLFSGTVNENVSLGGVEEEKPDQEDIVDAIKIAQGEEFVLNMPDKYESKIARGGENISGGQKQRLQIARAVARDPEFYIFDDSFSALDYKTDSILRKALRKNTKDSTNIIVAQRIGTIRYADKIIVLDKGKIVGMGKHNDLLNTCELYREIAEAQLRKEELYNA